MIRLRSFLKENQAALIVTDIGRLYFTGFKSSLGYLAVSKDKATLFLDGRYHLAAKQSVKNCEVQLISDISSQLNNFFETCKADKVLLEKELTLNEFDYLSRLLSGFSVEPSDEMLEFIDGLRAIKSEREIECIKKAQSIAEKALRKTLPLIKEGVTEKEIAAFLEYQMSLLGSEKPSFETIVVAGKKSAMPHGAPDDNKIKNGDFVTIDFGAVYKGYHSDMTRTFAVGFCTDKMKEVYNLVLAANIAAERAVLKGAKCSDVDKAARDVIENGGYSKYFTHSTGHSLGLEIHEVPSLSPKSEQILSVGNVVTDEPGIYIDGEFGVRIEDMLLVTENGALNLTNYPKNLVILNN